MSLVAVLPHVNAALNALSTVLLIIAFALIRMGQRAAHRKVMIAALCVSSVFLVSYLTYHFTAPVFKFPGHGWIVPVYFAMLISHVVLATVAAPLVAFTAWRAIRAWRAGGPTAPAAAFARHRALARWTFPIWLYVTVTGVIIYVTLYHIYTAP